jgi:anti-sigma-K factor RskA
LAACSECATKLARLRGAVSLLGLATRQDRPAGTVKAELMARVRVSREAEEHYAWPLKEEQLASPTSTAKTKAKRASSWWNWALISVAAVLALISVELSWQNRRIAAELRNQRKAADSLIRDRERIEKCVAVLAAQDTKTIRLVGTGNWANSSGLLKFNARAGVLLYTAALPVLPPDKSYQVWLLPAAGAPISAGLLGPGGNAWGNMWTAEVPPETSAKQFAITIEPVGGVAQPTGPRVLMGVL